MRTQLCPSLLLRQLLRQSPDARPVRSRGQIVVIFAVSLVALLLFVGLAIDAGIVYVSYGQLKRAVDSAAVAAATNFKRNKTLAEMEAAVLETLVLHNVNTDPAMLNLSVRVCDADSDGVRDASLETEEPMFFASCPDTAHDSPRKLIWVEAQQRTRLYFLSLLGFHHVNLETHATAEAAAVDLVLVIDISESMVQECESRNAAGQCEAWKSKGFYSGNAADYDPQATGMCNEGGIDDCHPLQEAKAAAMDLVENLYEGYDRVSVITFDSKADVRVELTAGDLTAVKKPLILANIKAIAPHDDAPFARMWPLWQRDNDGIPRYNPAYPDDRDGDGLDVDEPPCDYTANSWWDDGAPCDMDDKFDAFNWDMDPDEVFTDADQDIAVDWKDARGEDNKFTLVSTCTGCGIRAAANQLKENGRPGAVWVIIFLSDGAANMSDTHETGGYGPDGDPVIPVAFPNGFCTEQYWESNCFDTERTTRYCIDDDANTCPPGTTHQVPNPGTDYSVYDYALDMIDEAALTINDIRPPDPTKYNPDEPLGNDIAIYSIGLGDAISYGETLLRYMAAIGDDGDRNTDPCKSTPARKSCGNYYYAATGDALLPVFEDIASRIYTRITQ